MTTEEAYDAQITRDEAEREIMRHNCEPAEFFAEIGSRDFYSGAEVLNWLGY